MQKPSKPYLHEIIQAKFDFPSVCKIHHRTEALGSEAF